MGETYVSEEIFTHEHLWRAAEALYQDSTTDKRNFYYLLSSLTLTYLAFEAFVNFIGEAMCPEEWAVEKEAFRGKGDTIEAKLSAIVGRLPGYQWQKGQPPYQDIKRLKRFRDLMAHGKVVRSEYVSPEKEDGPDFRWSHAWDEFVEPAAVANSMTSVKKFCQSLVIEARKYSDEPHFVFDAFEGALASAEGATSPT